MRILITGANRGIGLELVRRYLDRGDQVFAACRSPHQAVELAALKSEYAGRLAVIQLEVTNLGEIEAAVDLVKTQVPAL
ncbi:MAG: SDR family NAD(P)-dependent oxidoreductase, partial [Anaerolineae bacterium]|nr:SDR family NAD(P)-dependent oxidoreductase [Anaerolineae bacterium]